MNVLSGTEKIMIATPTKAGHPRMLYNDTNARVICSVVIGGQRSKQRDGQRKLLQTWKGPEMAMRPYVQKSCNRIASTDMRFTMSPEALPRPSFERMRAFW